MYFARRREELRHKAARVTFSEGENSLCSTNNNDTVLWAVWGGMGCPDILMTFSVQTVTERVMCKIPYCAMEFSGVAGMRVGLGM